MSEPPGATLALAEAPPTDEPSKPLAAQRVLPLRRPGRWIATAVVLVLAAQFVHGLTTNPFYQWDRFGYWFLRPTVLDGLLITLEVADRPLTGRRWPVKQEPMVVPPGGTEQNLLPSGRRGRQPADVYAFAALAGQADLSVWADLRTVPALPIAVQIRGVDTVPEGWDTGGCHGVQWVDHPPGAHPRNRCRGGGVVPDDEARAMKTGGRDVCTPYLRLHIDLQRVAGALCRP